MLRYTLIRALALGTIASTSVVSAAPRQTTTGTIVGRIVGPGGSGIAVAIVRVRASRRSGTSAPSHY